MVASAPIPAVPILATRAGLPVYIPPPPPKVVFRTRLIEQLNERVRLSAGGTPGVTAGLTHDEVGIKIPE